MVHIPQMTDQREQERPLPNVGFNVRTDGAFGQENAAATDRAVQGTIGVVEQIIQKQQKEADEVVQLEAGSRASQFEMDWNNKIRNAQGKDAFGLHEQFSKDWDAFQSATNTELVKNDKQGLMVKRVMDANKSAIQNRIEVHQFNEQERYYKDQSESLILLDRKAAVDSGDPLRIGESIGKQKAVVDQMAAKYGWSDEMKTVKQNEVEQKTHIDYINNLSLTDPVSALKMLQDPETVASVGGADNAKTLMGFAEKQKERQNSAVRDGMINNTIKAAQGIADGSINDINGVTYLATQGIIPPESARSMIAYLSNPKGVDLQNDPAFSSYVDAVFASKDKNAINDLYNEVLSGGTDKRVNQKELQSFVKIAAIRAQGLSLAQYKTAEQEALGAKGKKKTAAPSGTPEIDSLYSSIMSWSKDFKVSDQEKAMIQKDFIEQVMSTGAMATAETKKIYDAVVNKATTRMRPDIIKLPAEGKIMIDKNGVKARVFPDGHYEMVK